MAQEHITLALLHDLFTAPQPNAELVGRLLRLRSEEVPRRDELFSEFEQVDARRREIDYGAVIAAAAAKTVDVASRLEKERAGASADLRRLLRLLPAGRRRVLERATTRFRSPALVELLIEAARVALADAPARAVELLTLAERVTRRVPPDVYGPAFCNSLAVRALAHRANAVRVAGDLTAAAAQWRQIHARIATEPLGDVDAEAEVACLEASLRLDQGRFDRAERLLGRARRRYRAAKDPEGLAKTLIKLAIAKRVQGQPSAGSEVKRLAAAISEIFAAQEVHAELARALTLSGLEVPLPALARPRVAPFNRRHGGRGRTGHDPQLRPRRPRRAASPGHGLRSRAPDPVAPVAPATPGRPPPTRPRSAWRGSSACPGRTGTPPQRRGC